MFQDCIGRVPAHGSMLPDGFSYGRGGEQGFITVLLFSLTCVQNLVISSNFFVLLDFAIFKGSLDNVFSSKLSVLFLWFNLICAFLTETPKTYARHPDVVLVMFAWALCHCGVTHHIPVTARKQEAGPRDYKISCWVFVKNFIYQF